MNSTWQEPKTRVEKRFNRQLWMVTFIVTGLIVLIALGFLVWPRIIS